MHLHPSRLLCRLKHTSLFEIISSFRFPFFATFFAETQKNTLGGGFPPETFGAKVFPKYFWKGNEIGLLILCSCQKDGCFCVSFSFFACDISLSITQSCFSVPTNLVQQQSLYIYSNERCWCFFWGGRICFPFTLRSKRRI